MIDMSGFVVVLAQGGATEVLGAPSGGGGVASSGEGVVGADGGGAGAVDGAGGAPGGGAPAGPGGFGMMLPLLFGLMIFMVVTSMMSGRKEKKKRAELMAGLKRRDKVQTVGGVIGTIAEIKNDEVVLKVDHGSNTRIRFARSAIQQVLHSADGGEIEEVSLENASYEDEPAGV